MTNFNYVAQALKEEFSRDEQYKLAKSGLKISKNLLKAYTEHNAIDSEVMPDIEVYKAYLDVVRYEALIKQLEADITMNWLRNNQV